MPLILGFDVKRRLCLNKDDDNDGNDNDNKKMTKKMTKKTQQ